ncbi:MAG: menaquinone biosynthesis family protein [Chlamydiales bacterium]|jgi:chorismate dehydratase|nr:menaquinone biosynthesis family protein [Chlamydiales bacterium]
MLRVGMISFVNALPLTFYLKEAVEQASADVELTLAHPTQLHSLLRAKKLDIAFISSFAFFEMEKSEGLERISDFGIAAVDEVMSVKLYYKEPFQASKRYQIGLTCQSRSSSALVKILAAEYWKINCQFIPLPAQALDKAIQDQTFDALLLIGDECLKKAKIDGYQDMDLAKAWHEATGLPFVFAVLAGRPEICLEKKEEIFDFLKALRHSLARGLENKDQIVQEALFRLKVAPDFPGFSGFKADLDRYYDLLHYQMSDEMIRGFHLFKKLVS